MLRELGQSFPCSSRSPRRGAWQRRLMCAEGSSSAAFTRVGAGEKC